MAGAVTSQRITWILQWLRLPNLIIIALVQGLTYLFFLWPLLEEWNHSPTLTPTLLPVFIALTLLVTLGGYWINDLQDQPIDQINRPDRVWLGRLMTRKTAWGFYGVALVLGFSGSLWLGWKCQKLHFFPLYPLVVAALWIYARRIKAHTSGGNLVVAVLCAAVIGILLLAESKQIIQIAPLYPRAFLFITAYMVTAFLTTLFRELLKDLADLPGDQALHRQTYPIRKGVPATLMALHFLGAAILLTLLFFLIYFIQNGRWSAVAFSLLLVVTPLGYAMLALRKAPRQETFRTLSQVAKWIIFAGLLLICFFE
jgi:4-hydroxybenzoate polyprenyltransferase